MEMRIDSNTQARTLLKTASYLQISPWYEIGLHMGIYKSNYVNSIQNLFAIF